MKHSRNSSGDHSQRRMLANSMEQNEWKVPPDNTVQVVDPMGMNESWVEYLEYLRKKEERPEGPKRNWIGIFISLGIISFVLIMVTIATFIVGDPPPLFYGRRIVITDLQDPMLMASPMGTQWVANDQLAYLSEGQGIRMLNTRSRLNITLVTNIALHQTGAEEFSVSSDLRYVLLVHDVIKGRLYTRTAEYSIYDVTTDHYYPLKLWRHDVEQPRFQHVAWVGNTGSAMVVVHEANLYLLPGPNMNPVTLTNDAKPDLLYNGVPDILYEEILGRNNAVWPSPTGEYLIAASFNESGVRELPVLVYSENVYPTIHNLRYPTVNTPIPEVWLWIYDLKSNKIPRPRTRLVPPEPITRSHYLVSVGWVNGSTAWVSWASRDQSTAVLATCEHPTWNCSLVHVNHKEGGGVSPVVGSVVWAGSWAVFPWSVKTLSGAWHNHVALVGAREGRHAPLTLEDYHVTEVIGYDTNRSLVYFRGSVLRNGAGQTAGVQRADGGPEGGADPNPALTYMVVTCLGTNLPSSHLLRLATNKTRASSTPLHKQEHLRIALKDLALPVVTSFDVGLEPALHAAVTLTLPPGWSSQDDTLLYPMVVQMIGPGEKDVEEPLWHLGWREYLSSGHQVAHAKVQLWGGDPSTRASTHTLAMHQAKVIRKMLEQFDFLDGNNVAVWGWGSGASLALDAAALEPSLIKCVAAVNPVVDWRAHGSFWAERLLGSSTSEGSGRRYEDSDLTRLAPSLGKGRVLLAHGTRDPAAHHAFLLAHALISSETYFTHVVSEECPQLTATTTTTTTTTTTLPPPPPPPHSQRVPGPGLPAAHGSPPSVPGAGPLPPAEELRGSPPREESHPRLGLTYYFSCRAATHHQEVYTDDDYMLDLNRYHLINAFTEFFFTWLHDPLTYELQEA
ncbi:hypothetical protein O3P69_018133 [Scylla paramamosain]|uniref:Uncharacterized protein n=1 Tax=Scylla paramamosain TaxID=85552 RepID=A0AAW0TIY3_SCYPA